MRAGTVPLTQYLHLNAQEQHFYAEVFKIADQNRQGKIVGREAVQFLKRFEVSPEDLKLVWGIASVDQKELTQEQFYVALRLIAYKQNSLSISEENVRNNIPVDLPRFLPSLNPFGQQMAPPPPPPPPPPQPAAAAVPQQLPAQVHIDVAPLGVDSVQKFEIYFDNTSQGKDVVTGKQVQAIFNKSNLPNPVLSRIWQLTDQKQIGEIDKAQFIVACHLLQHARSGLPLPAELPEALQQFIVSYRSQNRPKNLHIPSGGGSGGSGGSTGADFHNFGAPAYEQPQPPSSSEKAYQINSPAPQQQQNVLAHTSPTTNPYSAFDTIDNYTGVSTHFGATPGHKPPAVYDPQQAQQNEIPQAQYGRGVNAPGGAGGAQIGDFGVAPAANVTNFSLNDQHTTPPRVQPQAQYNAYAPINKTPGPSAAPANTLVDAHQRQYQNAVDEAQQGVFQLEALQQELAAVKQALAAQNSTLAEQLRHIETRRQKAVDQIKQLCDDIREGAAKNQHLGAQIAQTAETAVNQIVDLSSAALQAGRTSGGAAAAAQLQPQGAWVPVLVYGQVLGGQGAQQQQPAAAAVAAASTSNYQSTQSTVVPNVFQQQVQQLHSQSLAQQPGSTGKPPAQPLYQHADEDRLGNLQQNYYPSQHQHQQQHQQQLQQQQHASAHAQAHNVQSTPNQGGYYPPFAQQRAPSDGEFGASGPIVKNYGIQPHLGFE